MLQQHSVQRLARLYSLMAGWCCVYSQHLLNTAFDVAGGEHNLLEHNLWCRRQRLRQVTFRPLRLAAGGGWDRSLRPCIRCLFQGPSRESRVCGGEWGAGNWCQWKQSIGESQGLVLSAQHELLCYVWSRTADYNFIYSSRLFEPWENCFAKTFTLGMSILRLHVSQSRTPASFSTQGLSCKCFNM